MAANLKEGDLVHIEGRPAMIGVVEHVSESGMVTVRFDGIQEPVLSIPSMLNSVAIE